MNYRLTDPNLLAGKFVNNFPLGKVAYIYLIIYAKSGIYFPDVFSHYYTDSSRAKPAQFINAGFVSQFCEVYTSRRRSYLSRSEVFKVAIECLLPFMADGLTIATKKTL